MNNPPIITVHGRGHEPVERHNSRPHYSMRRLAVGVIGVTLLVGAVKEAPAFFNQLTTDDRGTEQTQTYHDGDVTVLDGANLRTSPHTVSNSQEPNVCAVPKNDLYLSPDVISYHGTDENGAWYEINDPASTLAGTGCSYETNVYINQQGIRPDTESIIAANNE